MANHMSLDAQAVLGLIDAYLKHKDENEEPRGFEIYHPSAFGKAQPLDAIVQTPNGPVLMKNIKVGDEICGIKGDTNTVVAIHPQGMKKVYRVTFSDGDYTECCGEHLWEVDSKYLGFSKPKIITTEEILKTYLPKSGHHHYRVKLPAPINLYGEWESMLSPYIIGVLLGDGCFRCPSPMITGNDIPILSRVRDELPLGVSLISRDDNMQHWLSGKNDENHNIVKDELKKIGLWDIKSHERFIPEYLLYTSVENRFDLLRGLMDSDGTASKRGHPSFTSISIKLIQQVAWLVKSLGGLTRLYERESKCNGVKTGSISYTLHISHPMPESLFYLDRKASRAAQLNNREIVRNISNVELIGEKECQCISINKPDGLYLTDHCIVTHNCLRLMQYQRYAERGYIPTIPDPHPPHIVRNFGNGHAMHDRWRTYFEGMGILRGCWLCTNPLCGAFDNNGVYDGKTTITDVMASPSEWYKKRRLHGEDELQGVFKPEKCVCGWDRFKYEEISVISDELNFHGHADMILDFSTPKFDIDKWMKYAGKTTWGIEDIPKTPVVVDMKSINHHDFQEVAKGNPDQHYLVQLTIYANILNCEYGILIYENKNNQRTTAFKVPRNAETWWPTIRRQALLMNEMVEVEDEQGELLHLLPPPRYSSRDSDGCTYCQMKDTCHTSQIWDSSEFEQQRKEFYGELA